MLLTSTHVFRTTSVISIKFSWQTWNMIILKTTENQGFALSLKISFWKNHPSLFSVKTWFVNSSENLVISILFLSSWIILQQFCWFLFFLRCFKKHISVHNMSNISMDFLDFYVESNWWNLLGCDFVFYFGKLKVTHKNTTFWRWI